VPVDQQACAHKKNLTSCEIIVVVAGELGLSRLYNGVLVDEVDTHSNDLFSAACEM
jgi:hypothetical protein